MVVVQRSKSAKLRSRLNYPIIDADAHAEEITPIMVDYIKDVGGSRMVERYLRARQADSQSSSRLTWYQMSPEERRDTWTVRPPWWSHTQSAVDRATVALPRLWHQRMEEFGVDFTIVYPSQGLSMGSFLDEELRRVACRAFNTFHADLYRDYADRLTPVAVIPMYTPQEAIDELEHVVKVLGLKAITFALVRRPVGSIHRKYPELDRVADRIDCFGIDSDYDYDPFWAKCVELKVVAASHSSSSGWGSRRSISNFMYNSTGHFGNASDALCKSLFMGGVTRRFPTLRFAFLEGGVGWACRLYIDMVSRWQKRNPEALRILDPANLDLEAVMGLIARYGDGKISRMVEEARTFFAQEQASPRPPVMDDWAACSIRKAEDVHDRFVPNFFFGCEADDPLNAMAFNTRLLPFGARLNAFFGSDIGHWDVPDMTEPVAEAYELVEHGLMTEEDFRDFMFVNPVKLYVGSNPDFFKGTAIEGEVAKVLRNRPVR